MADASFALIPTPFYVPGQYSEFNNSQANSGSPVLPQKTVLFGQKLAAGTAAANVPMRVFSADQVGALAGRGSMLHLMAKAYYLGNKVTPTWIMPLTDDGTAVKTVLAITVTGPATAAGEVDIYVGGVRYAVGVASGASATTVAAALVAAVQADTDRSMVATVDGTHAYQMNLTARNGGLDAGKIGFAHSQQEGEALPAGIGLALATTTSGSVNPVLTTAIANLGSTWFTQFGMPYTDSTSLGALDDELQNRFGPIVRKDAMGFYGINTDLNTLVALPAGENSQLLSLADTWDVLQPAWMLAAGVVAQDAAEPTPQRPRQTLALPGFTPRKDDGTRRDIYDQQQLLAAGVSTLSIDDDGTVRIQRLTTTYRTNTYGVGDNSYFDVEGLHVLANLRYSWRVRVATKWPRSNLGADGSIGPYVVTPSDLRNEAIALYQDTWMPQGWVQGGEFLDDFIKNVGAKINDSDQTRADLYLPPKLIRSLCVVATEIAFS
jgi:phage tail sheath gpL-like